MPDGLNEDTYILVHRKAYQMIRYTLYNVVNESHGKGVTPEIQREQEKRMVQAFRDKPVF